MVEGCGGGDKGDVGGGGLRDAVAEYPITVYALELGDM